MWREFFRRRRRSSSSSSGSSSSDGGGSSSSGSSSSSGADGGGSSSSNMATQYGLYNTTSTNHNADYRNPFSCRLSRSSGSLKLLEPKGPVILNTCHIVTKFLAGE